MATTAPFVKLLRQLSVARDDYRTGAFDITWDLGKATIYLVFGQPNHAVLTTSSGERLEGQPALSALVHLLPARFQVSTWRKEVVRAETLRCSLDELIEPFAQMAGAASPAAPEPAVAAPVPGNGNRSEVDFGLEDFPLLPVGASLWADASASVVHLDMLVPTLPDSLLVLTGPRLRAAGVVVRQHLIDAVWIDEDDRSAGEAAVMALMGASQGTISGYRLDSSELAEAVTMLWRCPVAHRGIPAAWIRLESLLEDLARRRRDCAIVVSGPTRGVALLVAGRLAGVYSEGERQPLASADRLAALLATPGARLTLRQQPDEAHLDHLPEASFHTFVDAAALPAVAPASAPAAPAGDGVDGIGPAVRVQSEWEAPSAETGSAEVAPRPQPESPIPSLSASDWPPPPPPPPPQAQPVPSLPAWVAELNHTAPTGSASVPSTPIPFEPAASAPAPAVAEHPDLHSPAPAAPAGAPAADAAPAAAPVPLAAGGGADYEAVKRDLIQISTLWLGNDGSAHAAALIQRARPSVEDIMSTIDAIASGSLPGHEPSVVQAMVREMRFHAAESLSGL